MSIANLHHSCRDRYFSEVWGKYTGLDYWSYSRFLWWSLCISRSSDCYKRPPLFMASLMLSGCLEYFHWFGLLKLSLISFRDAFHFKEVRFPGYVWDIMTVLHYRSYFRFLSYTPFILRGVKYHGRSPLFTENSSIAISLEYHDLSGSLKLSRFIWIVPFILRGFNDFNGPSSFTLSLISHASLKYHIGFSLLKVSQIFQVNLNYLYSLNDFHSFALCMLQHRKVSCIESKTHDFHISALDHP